MSDNMCHAADEGFRPMAAPDYEAIINEAIDRGDIDFLRTKAGLPPLNRQRRPGEGLCGCVGARDGEPLCSCKMWNMEVRKRVLGAALQRGKIVRAANQEVDQ